MWRLKYSEDGIIRLQKAEEVSKHHEVKHLLQTARTPTSDLVTTPLGTIDPIEGYELHLRE